MHQNPMNEQKIGGEKLHAEEVVARMLSENHLLHEATSNKFLSYTGTHWVHVHESILQQKIFRIVRYSMKPAEQQQCLEFLRREITVSQLNSNIGKLMNLKNGVLNLETGILMAHDKDLHFFNVIPIEFDIEAKAPTWSAFLSEIFEFDGELTRLMQDIFGYCLVPGNHLQKAIIFFGEGRNGKSTCLEILRTVLGFENTSALTLDELTRPFRLSTLNRKLANICDETAKGKEIAADHFKNLSAGGRVCAEEKYSPPFEFYNQAKLIFAANEFPYIKDTTFALHRRLCVVPFKARIPDHKIDVNLAEKLKQELPGILNWAIEGLKRVMNSHQLTASKAVDEAVHEFLLENDSVRRFVEEQCIIDEAAETNVEKIYQAYRRFCLTDGYMTCALNTFGRRLKEAAPGAKKIKGNFENGRGSRRPHKYRGIKLSDGCADMAYGQLNS